MSVSYSLSSFHGSSISCFLLSFLSVSTLLIRDAGFEICDRKAGVIEVEEDEVEGDEEEDVKVDRVGLRDH
jgi:hypothetical protein